MVNTPILNEHIIQVAETILHKSVISVTRTPKGEFNQVFIVETDFERFVMRIFRHGHWPEEGKLLWIEKQLTAYSIPHAKVVYYSRSNDHFSHGFMVSEFVQGKNGSDAMVDGDLSFDDFHKKLAVVLSRIHAIPLEKFGLIHSGEGEFSDLVEYKMNKLQKDRQKLSEIPDLDIRFIDRIEEKVREVFSRYRDKLYPVLVHGDATPDNSIVTPDGTNVLVDWDAATGDTWICDYAWLTYWGSHMRHLGTREERQARIRDAFRGSYIGNQFKDAELAELEKVYHLLTITFLLPYYYFDQKNMEAFEKTKVRLIQLLKE